MDNLFLIVARNSFFGVFSKLSIKLISFAFTIFIVRWLGDENYGYYSLIWSYVTIFSMLSDAGLGMYAIREMAKRQPASQYIAGNIIVMRLILATITITLLMITIWLLGYPGQFVFNTFLASTILLLYAMQDPLDAALQAHERFDISATAILVGQFVFVGAGVILLLLNWDVTGLIIAGLLSILVSALLAWRWITGQRQILKWRLEPALWPGFIRVSLPFGLIKLWLSWSLKLDIVILSWFWTHQMVGWYSAAYAIVLGIMVISNSINAAIYPALSRQYTQDASKMPKIYQLALKYLLLISLPIAGGISLTAEHVTHLLYGPDFTPATPALIILIWVLPLTFISEFLRYVLLATNRERIVVQSLGLVVLFIIGFNLWLIPIYGFLAAAIIAVAAEALLAFLYIQRLFFELKAINLNDVLLKPSLATLLSMGVMYVSTPFSLFGQIVLGGLVYISLIWLLQVIHPREYKLLFYLLTKYQEKLTGLLYHEKNTPIYPLVSVFIPAYNAGQFVTQAIESVLSQTYQNYELIIINDGSTDNTTHLLKQYQGHPKITIRENAQNMGISPIWNIGLSLCRGEFIAKLDADDFYEPHQLKTVVEFFQKHQEVGLVFSGLNLIYPDGRREPEMRNLHSWVRGREDFLPTLLQLCVMRAPTVFVRSVCYQQLGGVIEPMKLHSDWEMWVRIAANYPVGFIARRLANYRMSHGSNATTQAAIDGCSMHDLRLWLELLAKEALPYHLNAMEQTKLRWGIYALEMHFAALAARCKQDEMQRAYIAFAEEVLANQLPAHEIEHMRPVYTHLHQGICAFREQQFKEARQHFMQAIRIGPEYCKMPWIWSKLLLTFFGKTKWGILYK